METTTGSIFWFVLFACIGGVVVLVGLLMETLADKKWFKNIASARRWGSAKRWGEWIVIFGIVIEIVVAGWSAKDEWQTRQAAIKNNPLNQPAADISAILRLDVKGTNFFLTVPDPARHASLELIENINPPSSGLGLAVSDVRPIAQYTNFVTHEPVFWEYIFEFKRPYMPVWMPGINNTNEWLPPLPIAKEVLKNFNAVRIYVDFIPKDSEILRGDAKIFVNGIQKTFRITAGKTDKDLSRWNPNAKGIFLYATNSTP